MNLKMLRFVRKYASSLTSIASKLRSYKGELITVTAWSIAGCASAYSNTAGSI
ncbi:hypothetical protein [Pseudomonas chlororaphis]|uniref:hypothetical protein n=1 Tax=Pseudomonas chlororaphis TaxID=587753 RepID=UPI000F6D55E6|nr:hypothetical protein [Pseudomonas chlororaphis]AZC36926.1 Myo-inositol 2-dehydrogenase [Pseudomonas chlororaphis subsp. piscium]AZC43471.1 Myo-inositol 2-dehydrogenase [Pseudomonas chlororaphis subsp. piscium]WDG75341.1 hypothetical protein PUP65_13530 [Pseudomonas chlororaphis]WDH27023.1 hypothetical protein PUP81_20780 [Pseudomonas chlororaphis]WDH73861.1 hypothetical protein PUP78_13525 [Pseudomonas chlororaphis]